MSIRKMQNSNGMQPPSDLPDNVPVSVTTTWKKVVGQGDEVEDVVETIDDHRHSKWSIHTMTDSGWEQIGTEEGRPYSHDLRVIYGAGRYKCVPLNQNGQPIERLAVIELVAPNPNASGASKAPTLAPADDMPPFMRMLLAQQAEERAEARRAAVESARQRQEWEREQAKREWQRAERAERLEQERAIKEAEERRLSAERTDKLLAAGMTLAGTLMQSITTAVAAKPAESRRDINDTLLAALIQSRAPAAPSGGGIKDTLDMLLVLDQVAEKRAERTSPPPREEETKDDEGLMKSLMGVLPMLMAMRGGGAAPQQAAQAMERLQAPQADPQAVAEQTVRGILSDPDALSHLASQDPDSTARVFLAAVQRNPSLQAAVAKAFTEAQEG